MPLCFVIIQVEKNVNQCIAHRAWESKSPRSNCPCLGVLPKPFQHPKRASASLKHFTATCRGREGIEFPDWPCANCGSMSARTRLWSDSFVDRSARGDMYFKHCMFNIACNSIFSTRHLKAVNIATEAWQHCLRLVYVAVGALSHLKTLLKDAGIQCCVVLWHGGQGHCVSKITSNIFKHLP